LKEDTCIRAKRKEFLPFALPSIGEDEITEVIDSLRSGWITTGPKVELFEQNMKAYLSSRNAIAVSSCTGGLHVALTALGIGPGDEVVVPSLTFCSTANVVVHRGAKPVLVDVGDDFNMSILAFEEAITERTRAVIPVHYGGQPCELDDIYRIASKHDLAVVEDAAHAIGSTYKGNRIGSDLMQSSYPGLRRVTVFSFYAIKNMTTGEGGMITTDNDELAERMRLLVLHGMSRDAWKRYSKRGSWFYQVVEAGYKYNMSDIQAAIGIHQLKRLESFIETRREYAAIYDNGFRNVPEIKPPKRLPDRTHTFHLYEIRLNLDRMDLSRDDFIDGLRSRNIGTSVHFIPVHMHPFYEKQFGYKRADFPCANDLFRRIVSLPLYPAMTREDVLGVVNAILDVLGR
jgi:dTDP-4-amino-4,6-dideoxygalactose transaminase